MSFDYGSRKIGIAVGQRITGTASGIASVSVNGHQPPWSDIESLLIEWRPGALVVGLPLDSEGDETVSSRAARKFGEALGKRFDLPVYWVNEFLTSSAAQSQLKQTLSAGKKFSRRKQMNRDQLAAELILRSHFEFQTT